MDKLNAFSFRAGVTLLAVLALVFFLGQSLQAAPARTASLTSDETTGWTEAPCAGLLLASDDEWSIKHLFRGLTTRTRIVQFCMVIMCLALLIIMKK